MDDFTIALPRRIDVAGCTLETYCGLNHLWRMVERYKMAAPIVIRVLDAHAECVRAILADHNQTTSWQLRDETTVVDRPPTAAIEFPVTLEVKDARGNVLKMRLLLER
jgi:hypothetical protein